VIYGYVPYAEVGFSHDSAAGDNLNIRVRLETATGVPQPIHVFGPYPGTPSQQLRVTYKLKVTAKPFDATTGDANITGMGGSQGGKYAIERLALSSVNNDGTSNTSYAALEPADAASAGLSSQNVELSPIGAGGAQVDRGIGAATVQMTALDYVIGSFERYYEGTFSINEGVGTNWWALGIFDAGNSTFPFTFKYGAKQTKTAEQSLRVRFKKSWNRDLS
jgi:hypothetical protein